MRGTRLAVAVVAVALAGLGTGVVVVTSSLSAASQPGSLQAADLGWVHVPAGTFIMGCVEVDTSCLDNELPRHEVTFLQPFELMAAEVTVGQYARFVTDTGYPLLSEPDYRQTDRHPVVLLSWDDAVAFCAWAGVRLPTEAEWEHAARGGRTGQIYGWGNEVSRDRANYGADQCCAGATGGADRWPTTAPVRSFPPNDFGLYDMAGNVWEWVGGWLDEDYYGTSPSIDPPGAGLRPHRPGRILVELSGGVADVGASAVRADRPDQQHRRAVRPRRAGRRGPLACAGGGQRATLCDEEEPGYKTVHAG